MEHKSGKSERKIQAEVLRYLRNLTPLGKFYKIVSANERGVPDILGTYKGQFFAFEVKRPGEKLKTIQRMQAEQIAAAGGQSHRVESFEDVKQIIQRFELERQGLS